MVLPLPSPSPLQRQQPHPLWLSLLLLVCAADAAALSALRFDFVESAAAAGAVAAATVPKESCRSRCVAMLRHMCVSRFCFGWHVHGFVSQDSMISDLQERIRAKRAEIVQSQNRITECEAQQQQYDDEAAPEKAELERKNAVKRNLEAEITRRAKDLEKLMSELVVNQTKLEVSTSRRAFNW